MQKQIGCSGKSLSHHEHRRAVRPAGGSTGCCFYGPHFPCCRRHCSLSGRGGFTFKTVAFVWLKQNRKSPTWFYGLGYWTRGNAEICLLAKRGKPKRHSAAVHQFIISPIEQHSKKPDVTRDKIVALAGDLPRVELFARHKCPGWDAWGNEVECDLTLNPS